MFLICSCNSQSKHIINLSKLTYTNTKEPFYKSLLLVLDLSTVHVLYLTLHGACTVPNLTRCVYCTHLTDHDIQKYSQYNINNYYNTLLNMFHNSTHI